MQSREQGFLGIMDNAGLQIQSLKNNFNDYLCKLDVKQLNDTLEFEYIPWTYELIDKDMDIDEFHYDGIMRTFEKFLKNEIIELIKSRDDLNEIHVKKYSLISREVVVYTNLFCINKIKDENRLSIQDSTFKSIQL